MGAWHLAQLNIGRTVAPMDSATMAEFVEALDPVNALADASPGFIWRLQDDSGHATNIRAFDDPRMIINMSVWESLDSLRTFTYRSGHTGVLTRRKEWFEKLDGPHMVLWWIEAGGRPTVAEGLARLDHLARNGSGPYAFTFRNPHPAP